MDTFKLDAASKVELGSHVIVQMLRILQNETNQWLDQERAKARLQTSIHTYNWDVLGKVRVV
jgi:hypothetical protein